jgi:hypothetical protein
MAAIAMENRAKEKRPTSVTASATGARGGDVPKKGTRRAATAMMEKKERRDSEEKRRMPLRKNHLLAKEAHKIPPGLQNPSRGSVLENGPDGTDPPI